MIDSVQKLLTSKLSDFIQGEKLMELIGFNDYFTFGDSISIFHPDILREKIIQLLGEEMMLNDIYDMIEESFPKIIIGLKSEGFCVFDKWAVSIEKSNCNQCPAYRWVVHREGMHTCRLHVTIDEHELEKNKYVAKPAQECIRPKTVGACYLIAKEFNLPTPIVGKLDWTEYEQYKKEKNDLCV